MQLWNQNMSENTDDVRQRNKGVYITHQVLRCDEQQHIHSRARGHRKSYGFSRFSVRDVRAGLPIAFGLVTQVTCGRSHVCLLRQQGRLSWYSRFVLGVRSRTFRYREQKYIPGRMEAESVW